MIRVSASQIERVLACPGSAHLPTAEYNSEYADAGSDRHGDAEAAAVLGAHDDLPWQVRRMFEPGDVLSPEVALAYDVSADTARVLGSIRWRDYARHLRPFEIPMTVDLIITNERRTILVDYKGFDTVTEAQRNPQLLTGALAIARATGRDTIAAAIVYLGAAWRPADAATYDVFDLDGHAATLRAMVASDDRSLRTGKHCRYCPAFISGGGLCPEQRALAETVDSGDAVARIEAMIPFARDEDAVIAMELRARLKVLLARIDAALRARAAERPIPLGGGRMFGPHDRLGNREYDGRTVHAVVTEQLGREVADQVVEMTATQTAIERALKERGLKVAPTKKQILAEVEARGGMTRKQTTVIEEYEPRLELAK